MRRMIIVMLAGLALLAGCSYKPVRHLASDAALIKAGESTRKEVLRYLGEPDGRRTVAPGVEEFVYAETQQGIWGSLPVVKRWADPARQEMVVITLNGDQVTNCEFRLSEKGEFDWKKDTKWEAVK